MTEVLKLALDFTIVTTWVGILGLLAVFLYVAILDHWDKLEGGFKAAGVLLLIFVFWVVVIGSYKMAYLPKAEVTDVRT